MKKIVAGILMTGLVFSLVACGTGEKAKEDSNSSGQHSTENSSIAESDINTGGQSQIPNPFVQVKSFEEASEKAGFDILAPEKLKGFDTRLVQAIEKEMIEIIYSDGEIGSEGAKEIRIRKARGDRDISGDHNQYKEVKEQEIADKKVTLKGNGTDVFAVVWTEEGFSFSLTDEQGMTKEMVEELVGSIK